LLFHNSPPSQGNCSTHFIIFPILGHGISADIFLFIVSATTFANIIAPRDSALYDVGRKKKSLAPQSDAIHADISY